MKATCLIVDDEPLAVQLLKKHVSEMDNLLLAGTCTNAVEASSFLKQHRVELLFLDIQMPRITGIDFLKALQSPPAVIITTAHREYAVEGYDLDIVDYLLKPISFERFLAAVERFWRRNHNYNRSLPAEAIVTGDIYLSIKSGTKIYQFNESEIVYIESIRDFIQIHFRHEKKLMIKYRISQIEGELSGNFIRIHKSYIVNKKSITTLTANMIELGKIAIPVGESFKTGVEQYLKQ
ncbi:LytTR family two component transcriptional regulator [Lacibacter cauensis]|uniref:LytTR family two component transcriptional regulator n=1 Tax=Lacibacter cauensis TaxID=510947 RepID=A0A562SYI5_9BACT|nr:response regulator transcription factor [Lacibacter cauensis]TWI85776.1 LytTR family two component transcriptional regulator [Lacibacter cauensis]